MRTGMGTIAYYGEGQVDMDSNHGYVKNGRVPVDYNVMNGPGKAKGLSNSRTSLQSSETSEKFQLNGFPSTLSSGEYEEKNITISLQPTDRRFGFSVMGGSDEGFPAKIDVISEDSPAAQTSLCVNDEIVEVNGTAIDDSTHAEVIMQIHKCIQKRIINLTVRRYATDHIVLNHNHNYIQQTHGESTFTDPGAIINEGFTREVCVDRELSTNSGVNRVQPVASAHDPNQQTYTNQAFDEDDEPTDQIDVSHDGLRTLAYPAFLALLEHVKGKFISAQEQEDLSFLRNVFNSEDFNAAVVTHNDLTKIQAARKVLDDMRPQATNSQFLLTEVRLSLLGISSNESAEELLELINDPVLKGVLEAHDRIAMREALDNPFESDYSNEDSDDDNDPYDPDYDEKRVNVNIVIIDKTVDPLGATVRNDGDAVMISRVVKGGAAEKSGLLHEGDEILEINGNPVKGKNVNEVVTLLGGLEGTLTFVIVPGDNLQRSMSHESSVFMRAQFDYDPQDDDYNPCQELGLQFRKGEILEILNQDDPDWWQARRVDDEYRGLAKLIPSKSYQQQREARRITIPEQNELPSRQKRRCFCLKGKKKRPKKRTIMDSGNPDSLGVDDILTYEEMVQVDPNPDLRRPIVLIGPSKVGRRELREKLIRSNPSRFAPAIPHTSRPMRQGEQDGKDFHFISQEDFEADISAQKFAEYGQSDGYFYGTSLDEIRAVANTGKVCVLNLHCQALPILKTSDLKPYIVFVTLPSFDQLRKLRGTSDGLPFNPNVRLKDDELMDLIEKSREMDIDYAHYFDYTIVNRDLETAYAELTKVANYLETQPQWMPASWVR